MLETRMDELSAENRMDKGVASCVLQANNRPLKTK